MRIAIGADDAAFELKDLLLAELRELGHDPVDHSPRPGEPTEHYPDIAASVATSVADGEADRGVLICGTGIGMAISANKVPGIRAAQCHDAYSAERARRSNDAQIITLGARVIGPELARSLVRTFLAADYDGGRSAPKVERMAALDDRFRSTSAGSP